ncbi:guanylate kinase [Streptomyces graminifolii]|uniref:guanylate kinase n=1 Tax=Streptomyces TaxID=1883 RepID=UPI003683A24E
MDDAEPLQTPVTGSLLVLSGPSGTGKTTLARALLDADPDLVQVPSVTTRAARRTGESTVYEFVSEADFRRMADQGRFAQWIHPTTGVYYGTPREPLDAALAAGRDVVLDYSPEGYLNLRRRYPAHTVGVFVMAPSVREMARRLAARGTEDERQLAFRSAMAARDFDFVDQHDYHVINDDLTETREILLSIRRAERARIARQQGLLEAYARRSSPTLLRYYD